MKRNLEIIVEEDFVEGKNCLTNGVAWVVPEALYKMHDNINENDIALEVGTGGSTIFLANRCKSVMAIETSEEWGGLVNRELGKKELTNVDYNIIGKEEEIIEFIKNLSLNMVSIISVDTQGGYDRSAILNAILSKGIGENLKMVILDNYAHEGLFPDHYNKEVIDLPNWESFEFNHERWAGDGTKIYLKK